MGHKPTSIHQNDQSIQQSIAAKLSLLTDLHSGGSHTNKGHYAARQKESQHKYHSQHSEYHIITEINNNQQNSRHQNIKALLLSSQNCYRRANMASVSLDAPQHYSLVWIIITYLYLVLKSQQFIGTTLHIHPSLFNSDQSKVLKTIH